MSHLETTVTILARDTHDRDALFLHGVTGTEDTYGQVQVYRRTKVETVTDGDRHRVLDTKVTEEVLCVLDGPAEVTNLIRALSNAMATSLRVRPGRGRGL